MAAATAQVATSSDIREAAMNLNAKSFELRRTIAGVWDLSLAEEAVPAPEDTFSHNLKNESGESVVGDDERQLVKEEDFNPGGKYRSIVKLFIHYEFQPKGGYAMGTGWLISPDLLVTAGHCSYDWGHKYGRATEVKAYIGYRGKEKIADPNVQFRTVQKIVAPEGWLKTRGQKAHDVSFMKLNKPFTDITPIKYEETPAKGNFELGVVGYPGDLKDEATGEKGAFMYEMYLPTEFELATQPDTMIEYSIDTFGGNSGSPVFKKDTMVSIGAHVYGGSLNSASVIGKFGNPYQDYVKAFDLPVSKKGLNLIEIPRLGTSTALSVVGKGVPIKAMIQLNKSTRIRAPIKITAGVTNGRRLHEIDEEGFFDIFKKAISIGAPIAGKLIGTVAPLALGPAGAPIGALAGFALNAAGKLAESAEESGGLGPPEVPHGTLERAILAEAVFSAIHENEKGLSPEMEEGIFQDIKDTVARAAPTIKKVAPHVIGAMMEPALRIALDSLHKYNAKNASGGAESVEEDETDKKFTPPVYTEAIDHPTDSQTEGFLDGILSVVGALTESSMGEEDEEGLFGDIFKAGTRLAGKGLMAAAQHGLPLLVNALNTKLGGAESVEVEEGTSTAGLSHAALSSRALVAEATLQAVMKIPPQKLQEEGIFDTILQGVRKIAPIAMKMAPSVIGAINPTVGRIVGGVVGSLGQESTFTTFGPQFPPVPRMAAPIGGASILPAPMGPPAVPWGPRVFPQTMRPPFTPHIGGHRHGQGLFGAPLQTPIAVAPLGSPFGG